MKPMTIRAAVPRVFPVLLGATLFALPLAAQNQPVERAFVKDGAVQVVQAGVTSPLTNELTLPNDIKVTTNTTFRVGKGKERPLLEGQVLDAEGMLTSPDGSVVPVLDHVAMRKGQVTVARDGEVAPLPGRLVLGNGVAVTPDGRFTLPDGNQTKLLDGEMFRLNGQPIPARDTVLWRGGTMRLQKDGSPLTVPATSSLMMSDGTKVFGNGTVVMKDGSTRKLAEGEILALPGVQRKQSGAASY
jgi:hypothetical protein